MDNKQTISDPMLKVLARVSALELAMFAVCKTAIDKDGLIVEIDRLRERMRPEPSASVHSHEHYSEISDFLEQYRQYVEFGKTLRPGE